MASAIIHLCVAKEVNKYLKTDTYNLLLGSIAPDIAKQIGETKEISHFLDHTNEDDIPNIDRFLAKYKNTLNNPFNLGYFIHLLTDKYWFRDYIYQYIERFTKNKDKKRVTYTAIRDVIYNDYTNINIDLIDKYELPLDIFYEEFRQPVSEITEIPLDKLNILIDKMGIIIEESKSEKTFMFDTKDIEIFITNTVKYIIKDLEILGIEMRK
ncbi:MAG TPA: hypothetical protein IAC02_10435 [Candidatus Coprovivens excrementavium]|nr:hypothetical protein [Candidatus Coprovivens excrementavium]